MDLVPVKLELAGIGPDLSVGLAAQQLVAGHAQRFALDVPSGNVQRAYRTLEHHAATVTALAPEGAALVHLPERLIVHGVPTDHQLGKITHLPNTAVLTLAVGKSHFTKTGDPFVGIDPNENGVQKGIACVAFKNIYTGYFQLESTPSFKSSGKIRRLYWKRWRKPILMAGM